MKCDYLDHVWSSILIIFVNLYFIPELMKAVPFLKESADPIDEAVKRLLAIRSK